ncbi:MAG: NAD(P)-dependent oxidoreductase [Chlamydiae bacterium CG10_big_fil_rev_8_21_14_0_10_35_9]|nr:MAG: NAD(P)-dependent oxidoreductase [Chlamydiae bacterium CG10_big_fil_rev_8_21_14_0_10_35_9]
MLKVAILGCGYLGSFVAENFKQQGYYVTGTTRSPDKAKKLKKQFQNIQLLHSNDEKAICDLINNNDIIIVTIAADNPSDYENAYLKTSRTIKKCAKNTTPKTLIYTSSTFVYGEHNGHWVDEISPLNNDTDQGKILIETESVFRSLKDYGWKVLIFRLSEIYGPDRELSARIKKYQEGVLPGNGKNYTNMIHKDDIVKAMDYAIRHNLEGTFNLADDDHPTRKELYDEISHQHNLKKVSWDPKLKAYRSGNKRVSNHKIKAAGFEPLHPNRDLS